METTQTTTTQNDSQNTKPAASTSQASSSQKAPTTAKVSKSETNSSKSETLSLKNSEPSTTESRGFAVSEQAKKEAVDAKAEAAKPAELLAGKYKTTQELEQGYQELSKLYKANVATTESVRDDIDLVALYKEQNFPVAEDEESLAQYAEQAKALKEEGFNSKQVKYMMEKQKEFTQDFLKHHGLDVDVEAEKAILQKEWGADAETKFQAVTKWATDNLPADLLNKPLRATAAGTKLIEQIMQQRQGPVPITESMTAPTSSVSEQLFELDNQFRALLARPDYGTKSVQDAAQRLMAKKSKLMGL
jgi:hypothetical protein